MGKVLKKSIEFKDVLSAYLQGETGRGGKLESILKALNIERENLDTSITDWSAIKTRGIQEIKRSTDPRSALRMIIREILPQINMGRVIIVIHFCFSVSKANIPLLENDQILEATCQEIRNLRVDEWIKSNDGWVQFLRTNNDNNNQFGFCFGLLLIAIVVVFLFKM